MQLNKKNFLLLNCTFFFSSIFVLYYIFNLGITWDENYFIKSAVKHYNFFEHIFRNLFLSETLHLKEIINKYLLYCSEHPSFTKIFNGFLLNALLKFNVKSFYLLQSFRIFNLVLLYILIRSIFEYIKIDEFYEYKFILIVLILIFNPRFVVFISMGTADFAVVAFTTAAGIQYLKISKTQNYLNKIICCAIFSGLASASKFSGIIIAIIIFLHMFFFNRKYLSCFIIYYVPVILIIVFIFSPVFWTNTLNNFNKIFLYFTNHFQNYVYYLGKKYNPLTEKVPFHYPLFYLFFANSLAISIFFIPALIYKKNYNKEKIFFAFFIVFMLLALCKPNSVSFDGIKLFLPIYPFLVIIIVNFIFDFFQRYSIKWRVLVYSILVFFSILPFFQNLKYPTLYYNCFINDIKNLDNDIDIRGEFFSKDIISYFQSLPEKNLSVKILGNDPAVFEVYNIFGVLTKNIRSEFLQKNYDYIVMLNHKSLFSEREELIFENNDKYIPVLFNKYKTIYTYKVFTKIEVTKN